MKNAIKIKMINIRIDQETNENFKLHCIKNGYSISKRIRILIKNDIDGK